ncbi:MAG: translation elongation factor Ts [Anaerolineae bacterium]|jgi:elongation factor Ts|nr:elongation factor Ts [Ardenticatenia bacterium]HQZ71807.1 translation elongation factor Ts [Anaerolineae bacterium]HRA21402.1 translation elongation factor Ts [Anaerolineae bacterium]
MAISTDMIRELRGRTGAGILDVKNALDETGGDTEAAIRLLRERGLAKAAKKAEREASQGRVLSYIHGDPGRIGVLLELNCETDFVARTDAFRDLAHGLALHIAAANPLFVSEDQVPEADAQKEREIYAAQMADQKKPPEIMAKILDGKISKWMDETVMLRQAYVRDNDVSVGDMIKRSIAELGENIVVRRFVRFALGDKE